MPSEIGTFLGMAVGGCMDAIKAAGAKSGGTSFGPLKINLDLAEDLVWYP